MDRTIERNGEDEGMTDRISDYDKAIDALFEGLSEAGWLLGTGRTEGLGVGLSDRVKERLIERHGEAAEFIVFNTGYYRSGFDVPFEIAPPASSAGKRTFMERLRAVFGHGREADASKQTPGPRPRWQALLQERKDQTQLAKVRRDRILGRHTADLH